ncbi:MAG: hypothetical protein ABJO26_10605 [Luteolibacter sp.]
MSDPSSNPLNDLLSGFELGPAWAKAKSGDSAPKYKDGGEREYKPRRNDDRRGGGDRRDNRQGGGGGGGGGRGRDDKRGGGDRRDFKRGGGGRDRRDFQREEIIAPALGITVTLVPDKAAIQLVCKEVHQVARAYPLFDIAQIILAERGRSRAIFEASEKTAPFYRCKIEEAIYLTKEEAIAHLLRADWRTRFIEEATVEVEPPKGNFQSVARCGLSGQLLGPPNHHSYQTNLRTLHREAFSNMPFEAYAAKARTERSEEAVNAWLESMKIQTRWRVLSDVEIAARTAEAEQAKADAEAPTPEQPAAATATEEPATEPAAEAPEEILSENEAEPAAEETTAAPVEESTKEAAPSAEGDSSEEPSAEASAEEEAPVKEEKQETPAADEPTWFTDRAEFDRALAEQVLEKAFHLTRKAKVSAAIPGKHLSPGLLVRLKGTGTHHRKHPAIIIPVICKILEAEHMPVFKRKGKLYTGPARPKPLLPDAVLAPRPAEMVAWIRANNPAKLEGLWKAVLPEGATAPSADYAADLFWLLQQGHILLYTDDTLAVQEKPKPQEPKKPKAPKEKKPKAQAKDSAEAKASSDEPAPVVDIISAAVTGVAEIVSDTAEKLIEATQEATPETPPADPSTDPSTDLSADLSAVAPAKEEAPATEEAPVASAEEPAAAPEQPEPEQPAAPAEPESKEDTKEEPLP